MKHANAAFFVPHLGCPHQCSFCNQFEITGKTAEPTPEAAAETARLALETLGDRRENAEFAFFGGSFTAIPRERMVAFLEAVAPYVGRGGYRGVRVSTRPDAVGDDVLDILSKYRVAAVELGAQSMDDRVLALNGRGHTAADVMRASARIRARGFELGLQMMTGLPGDSDEGALRTARALCSLSPATVRIYPTLVLRGTRLEKLYRAGDYRPQGLAQAAALGARLLRLFTERGVKVIRLGLQQTGELAENYVAGPIHPAFRELCENRLYLEAARKALAGLPVRGKRVTLGTDPRALSKLAGQKRSNILALEREFSCRLRLRGEPLGPYEVKISGEGTTGCF